MKLKSRIKKEIRRRFKAEVFERDNNTCQICGLGKELPNGFDYKPEEIFDAHHITDRSKMSNGGYVKENGITVCKEPLIKEPHSKSCHMRCEQFHISNGTEWEKYLHPDDLYRLIGSSYELACEKSEEL